ncbi:MAG: sigma-70 family RNA polymerase sigma factor, partial [Myxococcota bacterium]
TFYVALTKLGGLQEPDKFKAWLMQIAVNNSYVALRRRRMKRRLGIRVDVAAVELAVSADASPAIRAQLQEAYARVRKMPLKVQVPFLLFHVEGLSLDEIAEYTGTSRSTVKRRLAYGNKKIRFERPDDE